MNYNTLALLRTIGLALMLSGLHPFAAAADATYVPLPDNGVASQPLYSTGAVQQATTDSTSPSPYVPEVPELTAYSPQATTATTAQFAPARVANSALTARSSRLAQSQSSPSGIYLSLTTPTPTAQANSNVTITLSLVDNGDTATGPGSSLFSYDTNIGINNTYLSFVGGFTVDPSSPFFTNENVSLGNTSSNLRVAYSIGVGSGSGAYVNATNGVPITLGSFVVHVAGSGLPPAGTTVTIGSQAVRSGAGGSEVINGTTFANVLTGVNPVVIAPEPPGTLPLLFGISGLALLAWRKRSQAVL